MQSDSVMSACRGRLELPYAALPDTRMKNPSNEPRQLSQVIETHARQMHSPSHTDLELQQVSQSPSLAEEVLLRPTIGFYEAPLKLALDEGFSLLQSATLELAHSSVVRTVASTATTPALY